MSIQYKQTMYVDTFASLPSVADNMQLAFVIDTQSSYYFNLATTSWLPLGRQVVKRSTVVVDGKTAGATTIYTLEPAGGLNFYPTQIVMRAVNINTAIIKPTFSVGSNASTYDNIATGSLLNTLTSLLGITAQPLNVSTSPALAAGTQIKANVTVGATATAYTFYIDILGYYA